MSRILAVVVLACLAVPARAEPILAVHPIHFDPAKVPNVIDSHVVFLNRCSGGCTVSTGATDSRTDTSDIGRGQITAYRYGNSRWQQVVSCVTQIMSPFNITVTDQDPGTADHFEIMVGGIPQDIGLPANIGGIADYACNSPGVCSPYEPDALVFDFSDVWGGSVTEDCATIAQEIAHAWTLDHVIETNDPMTYNRPLQTPLGYHDGALCGSDCVGGQSPFMLPCNGQQHTCMSTGQASQNEIQIIKALFGPAGAKAPTLSITSPSDGSAEQPGFEVDVSCTSPDGIQEVDLSVDGVPMYSLTQTPYKFMTPGNLKDGTHKLHVLCATNNQATATADLSIIIGQKCSADADCPANDLCYESACIPGQNAPGGLGAMCQSNADCASGACGTDGMTSLCVIPCDPSNDQCPNGFGCLQAGSGGVCWLGAAKAGGGCCDTGGGSPAGPAVLALGVCAALITRRRKRSS